MTRTNIASKIAFAFDIDGVLLRGKTAIPRAADALRLLSKEKVPFVLLTNGGGITEKSRANFIAQTLDVELSARQIIQSHTPFKSLVRKHNRVLCVGGVGDQVRHVARDYGFKDAIIPMDFINYNKAITPFTGLDERVIASSALPLDVSKPVDAILVFNDSRDGFSDLQIMSDLLNSKAGLINTKRSQNGAPSIPIYFSNNDLLWPNTYNLTRFGQGAFRIMMESLYREINGQELNPVILGKPSKPTYDYAHQALINWTSGEVVEPELGVPVDVSPFENVYMVGDNPASDIIGGFNYGWETCLVRTGVYRDNDPLPCKPTMIVDDVYEAVTRALEIN